MALVVVSLDSSLLEGAVHSFDLTVGSRMSRLGQAVVDIVLSAGVFEQVRPEALAGIHGDPDVSCGREDIS